MNPATATATDKLNHLQLAEKSSAKCHSSESDSCSSSSSNSSNSSSSSDDDDFDDDDELMESAPVKGLFCERLFATVKELYQHEWQHAGFHLADTLRRYNMDMLDYIKMVNYIRLEKPSVSLFQVEYKTLDEIPWSDERYLKTTIEDDAALQFDVEEDLDTLELAKTTQSEINNNNNSGVSSDAKAAAAGSDADSAFSPSPDDLVRFYKNKARQAESKVEELVEIVDKLRNLASDLLSKSSSATVGTKKENNVDRAAKEANDTDSSDDDSAYVNSYSNYSIHMEMLQDQVRTQGYMNAILDNSELFKDKVVLDVGCGSGILSLFAAKAGAKLVIAVDMSNIIEQAMQIAKENDYADKIVFLRGKMEQVKLPVEKVDIIISEWMGYFLLFESMLDSVLYARDKYLQPTTGIVLPNYFEMHLFGVSDVAMHERTLQFWSDVYGFRMSSMKSTVLKDAQITTIDADHVVTDMFKFKAIDCINVSVQDVAKFEVDFEIRVNKDALLTGIGSSFDTFFNQAPLLNKSSFSTSPAHTTTHWQQTLFQFDEPVNVTAGSSIKGKITSFKNPNYLRSYVVIINVFDRIFKYKVE